MDFSGSPVAKTLYLQRRGARVRSLVGELRSYTDPNAGKAGGEEEKWATDGWMASPTQWT